MRRNGSGTLRSRGAADNDAGPDVWNRFQAGAEFEKDAAGQLSKAGWP
jgi:hypothetical protein